MDDKIIVTNRGALQAKYGAAGYRDIAAAVAALTAADKARGIVTRLVAIDDKAQMKRCRGKAVTDRKSAGQNKRAIDAVFKALDPDYLLILGSIDVIPHQDLKNAAYEAGGDDDKLAYGDLPYACDAPYSTDTAKFVGPKRVVGRLPDLTGAKKPDYLVRLLQSAAAFTSRPPADYAPYFGLSTRTWHKSTSMSLDAIFGNDTRLRLAPPSGPSHPASFLRTRSHFINCHGAESDATFYGEDARSMPPSLTTRALRGKTSKGTVVAAECCYGAQLYDSVTLALDMPICQQYLGAGAYGYFGSTTIAYGPADENGAADLIAQYFLLEILGGASIGRAALAARQRFVAQTGQMDPIDLKTLGQFCLYGDPSVHPVRLPTATRLPPGVEANQAQRMARHERRARLKATGEFLQQTKPTASKPAKRKTRSPTVKKALRNIARRAGISPSAGFKVFAVKAGPAAPKLGKKAGAGVGAERYYVAVKAPPSPTGKRLNLGTAVVAKEAGNRIVGYRVYRQR
jgi:Peptidase family C25